MQETIMVLIFLIVVLVAIVVVFQLLRRPKPAYDYRLRKEVMTNAERECFAVLLEIVSDKYHIFPQIHLPTILDYKTSDRAKTFGAFRHIDEKSVDFVLCEKKTLAPKLAIELDDWSHWLPRRQDRDREVERILKGAGLPLLRIEKIEIYDGQALLGKIMHQITPESSQAS